MKKTVFFLLVFLFMGGYLILNSLNTDLDKNEGKLTFAKAYFGWMFGVASDAKAVVGYAADKNWLPDVNNTNNTNSSED